MSRYQVTPLSSSDFPALMEIEETMFGASGDGTLGAYYIRLCCDFFGDCCFKVAVEDRLVGYLLAFVRGREAYCTTLALLPEFQGSRATILLIRTFIQSIADRVDCCWFTVEPENTAARALHARLGAVELGVQEDFYGAGRTRIVSRVDREAFLALKRRFVRLGLVDENIPREATATVSEVAPASFRALTWAPAAVVNG